MLEIAFVVCAAFGGYSLLQKVISPFKYFMSGSSTQIIDSKPQITVVPYPYPQPSGATSPTINNQNSNGLFAYNSSASGTDQTLLPLPPAYLLLAAGTGYLVKKNVTAGSLVLHNSTSWSHWTLHLTQEQEKDLTTALQQEIVARYPDCQSTWIQARIRNDIAYEYRCLLWFKRIGTLASKLYLSWLFEVDQQDLLLAQQAITTLELMQKIDPTKSESNGNPHPKIGD